jgi:4-hydroxyphenylacetate 3-monooxygenase
LLAETTGVIRFDHIQEKLGELWTMVELTRSAILAAEAGASLDEGGVMTPDQRPFVALRATLPKWMARANELLQLIGGGGFMLTPARKDLTGPRAQDIRRYLQAANSDAEQRIRLFRLAWDFVGSDLGGRSELYERFYLSDPWRMTVLAYQIADKEWPTSLVRTILEGV